MPLPEGFLSELKMRNDITDVASNYVNLKRRGRNMVGLCPFHGEKTPSFNIYTENGSFFCFGCGVGGDVITFIMKTDCRNRIFIVKRTARRLQTTFLLVFHQTQTARRTTPSFNRFSLAIIHKNHIPQTKTEKTPSPGLLEHLFTKFISIMKKVD